MAKLEIDLGESTCPNCDCADYGIKNKGNIAVRGTYGKDKRTLLYCRTCGKRFAATFGTAFYGAHLPPQVIADIIHHAAEGVGVRATARLLGMHKTTVNNVILRTGAHCAKSLDSLLKSLGLTEVQLDELWAFVKKKNVMGMVTRSPKMLTIRTWGGKKVRP